MATAFGELPGRVAIVTGGSRGIGRATVDRLTANGCAVVVNYVHEQGAAESTVEAVLARRGAAVAIRADVADDVDVERLFAETNETFGGVDFVVHAAHTQVGAAAMAEVDLDEFDALLRTTTRATFIVNREAARQVRNGGTIVNLSGSVADSALLTYGVYATSMVAIDVLTRVFALELRERDITVNAVSLEVGKPREPGLVADVIAYLLSNEGHAITGQVLRIDNR